MNLTGGMAMGNGDAATLADLPTLPFDVFRERVVQAVEDGAWIASLHAMPDSQGRLQAFAVLAHAASGRLWLFSTHLPDSFSSLTPDCAQAHLFEREMFEQWGVVAKGHPWLKPVRFHPSYRDPSAPRERALPAVTDFFRMEGEELHEVAVGPVHAGIIEPGHFRFLCHGEQVHHLEIALGFQHRGLERALVGGPNPRTIPCMETAAGDTTIGHTLAYCHNVEALSRCNVPVRAAILRAVSLELERLANHTGDL